MYQKKLKALAGKVTKLNRGKIDTHIGNTTEDITRLVKNDELFHGLLELRVLWSKRMKKVKK